MAKEVAIPFLTILSLILKPMDYKSSKRSSGILPNEGGGGERLLWCAVKALQEDYPDILSTIFTADHHSHPLSLLAPAIDRFRVKLVQPLQMDIVLEEDGQQTGFLAQNVDEYADAILKVLKMPEHERVEMASAARRRASKFSEQRFYEDFQAAVRPVFGNFSVMNYNSIQNR